VEKMKIEVKKEYIITLSRNEVRIFLNEVEGKSIRDICKINGEITRGVVTAIFNELHEYEGQ